MTRLQSRFKTIIRRHGDDLGGAPAVVAPLALAKARNDLPDAAVYAANRPIWIATAAYDHPALEGQTLLWGIRAVVVKRAVEVRFGGKPVARLLILFSTSAVSPNAAGGPETPEDA